MNEMELARLVRAEGESTSLDHKGPTSWDEGPESAKITKDVLAFANTRGGGYIIVGTSEAEDGTLSRIGLSEEQAATFDTTRVAQWVNSKVTPSVRLVVHRVKVDDRLYVVIQVSEFENNPVMCVKDVMGKDGKRLLGVGQVYSRGEEACSRPIERPSDLDRIISLAASKRGDELLERFRALLAGTQAPQVAVPEPVFAIQVDPVFRRVAKLTEQGSWVFEISPTDETLSIFASAREAAEALNSCRSRYFGRLFPGMELPDYAAIENGWVALDKHEAIAISRSAALVHREVRSSEYLSFGEMATLTKEKAPPNPGSFVEYNELVFDGILKFMLMGRWCAAHLTPNTAVNLRFGATRLADQKLVTAQYMKWWNAPSLPSAVSDVVWSKKGVLAGFASASWKQLCEEAILHILRMLNDQRTSGAIIQQFIGDVEGKLRP